MISMTKKQLGLTVLGLAVALAAVPVAHAALGGVARHLHGHHGFAHDGASHADIDARIASALDALALDATTRADVEGVIARHRTTAEALVARLRAGEIDEDTARTEHDAIVAAASSDLAAYLTQAQIDELRTTLHPER